MSVELLPHNQFAYENVKEEFKSVNKCCVVHPTSTGKTYIALKLVEDNLEKKVLFLAPGNAILHQIKEDAIKNDVYKHDNFRRMTYQYLNRMPPEEIERIEADIIIVDEFQHGGAENWGKAIETLMNTHPESKILGLSATPIRYLDSHRDMTMELFDGHIASEITFDDAIESGILGGFDYIATTYNPNIEDSILDGILNNAIVAREEKAHFENLKVELKNEIEENRVNLPNLLGDSMVEKNGKYIFFCKNIEEKRKMIDLASEMFAKVNPNIKIYDIDYTKNDVTNQRTIQAFRKANEDDGALKILYNVDMLVEGFHLKEIAGGLTTRPTQSPRIAFQEVGRILSTDTDKRPVFIDLADSLRQLEIIKTMGENRNTGITRNRNLDNKEKPNEKIRVYDYTSKITGIIDQMTTLTVDRTTLEQKIEILEKYQEQNDYDVISGKTTFEGHPIGFWAIQIRAEIKRNVIKDENIIKRIEELGILKTEVTSINDKIKTMSDFAHKYPMLMQSMTKSGIPNLLLNQIKDENLLKEANLFNRDYNYMVLRYRNNKLPDDIIKELQDSKIGGVFNTNKKDVLEEYKNADERTVKFLKSMIKKYGTIEYFQEHYVEELMNNPYFKKSSDILVTDIDISKPNLMVEDEKYLDVIKRIYDKKIFYIINSKGIEEAFSYLPEKHQEIINRRLGFDGREKCYAEDFKEKYGDTRAPQTINMKCKAACVELRRAAERKEIKLEYNNEFVGSEIFMKEFIQEYGIFKRDDVTDSMRQNINKLLEKYTQISKEMRNRAYLVDDKHRLEILENHFGKIEEPVWDFHNKYFDKHKQSPMIVAVADEKNRDYINELKLRQSTEENISYIYGDLKEEIVKLDEGKHGRYYFDYLDMYSMLKETGYSERIEKLLAENGLQSGMTEEQLAEKVRSVNMQRENIKSVSDLSISDNSRKVLNAVGIKKIDDFKNYSFSDLTKISETINTDIRGKITNPKTDSELKQTDENKKNNQLVYFDSSITVEDLDFSVRTFNCVKRAGYNTLGDLKAADINDLMGIRNLGKKSFDELISTLLSYGIDKVNDEPKKNNAIVKNDKTIVYNDETSIDDLNLSVRAYNSLYRGGLRTLGDLREKSEEELLHIRNLGKKSFDEVIEKLKEIEEHENPMNYFEENNENQDKEDASNQENELSEYTLALQKEFGGLDKVKMYCLPAAVEETIKAYKQYNGKIYLKDRNYLVFKGQRINTEEDEELNPMADFYIDYSSNEKSLDEKLQEERKAIDEKDRMEKESKIDSGELVSSDMSDNIEKDELNEETVAQTDKVEETIEKTVEAPAEENEEIQNEPDDIVDENDSIDDKKIDEIKDKEEADRILTELLSDIESKYAEVQNRIEEISTVKNAIEIELQGITNAFEASLKNVTELESFLKNNKRSLGAYAAELQKNIENAKKKMQEEKAKKETVEKRKIEKDNELQEANKEKEQIEKIAKEHEIEI